MRNASALRILSLLAAVVILAAGHIRAEEGGLSPVAVGEPMPDFSLPSYQGGTVALSGFEGKNLLLIFPRGRAGDHWCHICHYQYAELAELEKETGFRKKYNLEILYVLPYDRGMVEDWVAKFPRQMADIESWKNPADPDNLSDARRAWMERSRLYFPETFAFEEGAAPIPFPILIDAGGKVSKGLGLYTMNWDRIYVEQNVPTIYLVGPDGEINFKYHSQNTFDRPKLEYLERLIGCFGGE